MPKVNKRYGRKERSRQHRWWAWTERRKLYPEVSLSVVKLCTSWFVMRLKKANWRIHAIAQNIYIIGKECHTKSIVLHARIMCGNNIHYLRRQIKNVKRLYITKLKKILASECGSAISQIKIIINVPIGIQLCEP